MLVVSDGPTYPWQMSDYPYWSLNFDLRSDLPEHVMGVLRDVAAGRLPQEGDLAQLHPVVRFYLSDWTRMLVGEEEPWVGSPVRMFRHRNADLGEAEGLSIEFSQHDDEYANGGWVFWLWVLSLVHRPSPRPTSKSMIGFVAFDRDQGEAPNSYFADHEGLDLGDQHLTFQTIDQTLEAQRDDDFGYGTRMDE